MTSRDFFPLFPRRAPGARGEEVEACSSTASKGGEENFFERDDRKSKNRAKRRKECTEKSPHQHGLFEFSVQYILGSSRSRLRLSWSRRLPLRLRARLAARVGLAVIPGLSFCLQHKHKVEPPQFFLSLLPFHILAVHHSVLEQRGNGGTQKRDS